MKRYCDKVDCCDPVEEKMLVEVCPYGMLEEYPTFSKLVCLLLFKLIEAARRTESMCRAS